MKLTIIPGVRQDHLGRMYRIAFDYKGKQRQVFCDAPELTPRAKRALARVTVVSMAYHAALDLIPQNEEQRIKRQAILDRGPVYTSLACYQGSNHQE